MATKKLPSEKPQPATAITATLAVANAPDFGEQNHNGIFLGTTITIEKKG